MNASLGWWVTDEDGSLTHTKGDNEPVDPAGKTKIGDDGMFGEAGAEIENADNSNDYKNAETNISPDESKNLADEGGFTQVEITETSTVTQTQFMPDADFTTQQTTTYTISERESKSITYMPDKVANNIIGTSETEYGKGNTVTPWWSPSMIRQDPKVTKSYSSPGGKVNGPPNHNAEVTAFKVLKQLFQGMISN